MDKESEIRLEHRLELRRLLIDRVGIGLLVIAAAFASNWLLERVKNKSAKESFMLEKRLEAITSTQEIHSKITTFLYTTVGLECSEPDRKVVSLEKFQQYQNLDQEYRETANSRIYLLSSEYQTIANQSHNLVAGIAWLVGNTMNPDCQLRIFLNDITNKLEFETRDEIGISTEGFPRGFTPVNMSPTEIEELGLLRYLEKNTEKWTEENKKTLG